MNYKSIYKDAWLSALLLLLAVMLPDLALANTSPLSNVMYKILCILENDIVKAVATIAVIVVGFGAVTGRIQWGVVLIVAVGVGVIFLAPTMISFITNTSGASCGGGGR